jgi:hypothetical protein
MRTEQYDIDTVGEVLRQTAGIASAAAIKLGCSSRTVRNYLARHPQLREIQLDCVEDMLDLSETKLIQNIKSGKEASVFFYLKTKGKERGYIEGRHHSGPNGGPIPIMTSSFDPSKLDTETLLKLRDAMVEPDAVADVK